MIFLFNLIIVILRIGFFTLLERKILSYINVRKGPNKVGFMGILQPFRDAIKLFSKEIYFIIKRNYYLYIVSPIFIILLILILWISIPFKVNFFNINLGLLIVLCIISVRVFFLIFCGWSSNSLYSILGAIRSISQFISYEVRLILILLRLVYLIERFSFFKIIKFQNEFIIFFILFFLSIIFFVRLLAELNRTPFDLSEGESELVSGFNIDYIRGIFGLIFISEYGRIIFIMYFFIILYFGIYYFSILFYLNLIIFLFLLIWIRGTLPRIRYDKLIMLIWKKYLLISLNYLFLIFLFKLILN